MRWMREHSWSLSEALPLLAAHLNRIEKRNDFRGSVQTLEVRRAAQLVGFYHVPVDCFDRWDP
jgi:hypothetical protein